MASIIEPLVELAELEARLEFDLDDEKLEALAEKALVDASILVREYGVSTWTADTAPPIAVMLTLKAAVRFVNNPMSLETARGADETNMWGEANSRGVYLERDEIELLRDHRKTDQGFQAPRTYAFNSALAPRRRIPGHHTPVAGYGSGRAKYFPDYQPGDEYFPYYPEDWQ